MQVTKSKKSRFIALYNEHSDKIYRLCYGYLHEESEVEDLFQQVLLNIWENLESFRGEAKITTWIYRITVNTALTFKKKQQRLESIHRNPGDFSTFKSDKTFKVRKDPLPALRDLNNCISKLEKQDRIIISLYLEDLSYKQISKVVGISTNYVGVKINRIKKELQSLMPENHEY